MTETYYKAARREEGKEGKKRKKKGMVSLDLEGNPFCVSSHLCPHQHV